MRVLVVHNAYRSSTVSGENRSVETEVAVLREAGVEVETYTRSSDEIDGYGVVQWSSLATRPMYSHEDSRAVARLIERLRPDVVHVHNLFPLISPWVVHVARGLGVPVVHTVHNYRHVCIAGRLFREGRICEDCRARFPWPGIVHGCYRGSRLQSVTMAAAIAMHRKTWQRVTRFVAISGFIRRFLEDEGVPPARISVVPSFVVDPGPAPPPPPGRGFLFAGRLEVEKGVPLLLDAWARFGLAPPAPLVIAGDGPERLRVERAAGRLPGITYVGRISQEEVVDLMAKVAVVVVPSAWHEPMGRTVIEAFARQRPVVATTGGAPGELVDETVGWQASGEPAALAEALRSATEPQAVLSRGAAARRVYEARFSPPRVLERLLAVYRAACASGEPVPASPAWSAPDP